MVSRARVVAELALLALLSLLDARDLWFKARWLGGSNSFAFATTETLELAPDAMAKRPVDDVLAARVSGWTSFLQRCDSMQAFRSKSKSSSDGECGNGGADGVNSFLHVLSAKCDIGGDPELPSSELVMSSGVRPDSMAWVACSLVVTDRRPPICREGVVADFARRYRLATPRVAQAMMAEPMSSAEAELLALLDVISVSVPLSRIVCVEGVELKNATTAGGSRAHVFGCASPSAFRAAFVGLHARAFRNLHEDKAWLTLDDTSVLGMHFSVRQSATSSFRVVAHHISSSSSNNSNNNEGEGNNDSGRGRPLVLVHSTSMTLSCFGFLFNLMILLDAALLLLHATGALEIARVVVLRTTNASQNAAEVSGVSSKLDGAALSRQTLLSCSLYRSYPVALLTVVTQLLGWMLLPAHAVVWSWGSSWTSRWHVCLTLLRVWTLVLLALHSAWDTFVSAREAQAYRWTRWTYISSAELVAIVSTVLLCLRAQLLAAVGKKHLLENQRVVDAESFPHVRALSNAYGDEQESQLRSRTTGDALRLLFAPLSDVLFWSMLFVGVVLAVRYNVNRLSKKKSHPQVVVPTTVAAAAIAAGKSGNDNGSADGAYARLPIEELLDNPIRARSLVRSDLHGAEKRSGRDAFLHTTQLLEHGVVFENCTLLCARWGFFGVLPAEVRTDGITGAGYHFGGGELGSEAAAEAGSDAQQGQPPPSPDTKRRRSLRW